MNPFCNFAAASVAVLSFAAFNATAAIDANAPVVKLRYDDPAKSDDGCVEGGVTLNNCFTFTSGVAGTLPFSLTGWIANTRKPDAARPLDVDIGPGLFFSFSFTGTSACNAGSGFTGYVNFRGAGMGKTIVSKDGSSLISGGCLEMSFSDMTFGTGNYGAIEWYGGGTSTWRNVEVNYGRYLWIDRCVAGAERGKHYWFGSRLHFSDEAFLATGYVAACDEHWFFGSELLMDIDCANFGGEPGTSTNGATLIDVSGTGEVHVYGSAIRANATCSTQAGTTLKVVKAESGGIVHIHGTGIDAVSEAPNDIRVLLAAAGGEIHANVSAYNLSNVAGSVIRVSGAGHVHAPYVWEHIPDATKVPGFASAHGADTTTLSVATDNNHPHTVVYSKSCPSGTPWYDQVDKVCR